MAMAGKMLLCCSRQLRCLSQKSHSLSRSLVSVARSDPLQCQDLSLRRMIGFTMAGRHRCLSAKSFRGVTQRDDGRWDADIIIDGEKHNIGTFDLDFQAARAYDEWMVLLNDGTSSSATNFSSGNEWVPQSKEILAESDKIFETHRGVPFNVTELVDGLEKMNAQDINVIDLEGKTSLAEYFIFVTGKSVPHMRKMMDTVLVAFKRRRLPALKKRRAMVEGRDCDDWMLVDCDNIVVHAFDDAGRKNYDLDNFWADRRIEDPPLSESEANLHSDMYDKASV